MNRLGRDPCGDQLPSKRGVKVDRQAARVGPRNVACRLSASGSKSRHDVCPDFVATPEDRWPQRHDEVTGGDTLGGKPGHGVRADSRGGSAPSGVEGRHGGRVTIDQKDGHAIGGPHDGNGACRTVPSDADHPVGRRRARPPRFRVDDDATVHLSENRGMRLTKSRRAEENSAARFHGAGTVFDRREIEVRPSEGEPRAEGMGHPADRLQGRAAREPDTVDLLQAPNGVGHLPAYFDDERLLTVALISAASFA